MINPRLQTTMSPQPKPNLTVGNGSFAISQQNFFGQPKGSLTRPSMLGALNTDSKTSGEMKPIE